MDDRTLRVMSSLSLTVMGPAVSEVVPECRTSGSVGKRSLRFATMAPRASPEPFCKQPSRLLRVTGWMKQNTVVALIWRQLSREPLTKFIERVILPPLEGASLSPSVEPEPA